MDSILSHWTKTLISNSHLFIMETIFSELRETSFFSRDWENLFWRKSFFGPWRNNSRKQRFLIFYYLQNKSNWKLSYIRIGIEEKKT